MSSGPRTLKKGEQLFKEGDKIQSLFFIQSGSVMVCMQRKKTIEVFVAGPNQILGEAALSGMPNHPFSAICTVETKVLEVPIDAIKAQIESQQGLKAIIKSMADRLKLTLTEMKSTRLEKDASPCAPDEVAKAFGSLFHTLNHKGNKDGEKVHMEWSFLKQYAQRIFGESPKRLEQMVNLFVKLKIATYEMGKNPDNPDGPEEIQGVEFSNFAIIEAFFEFYQYYYFKALKPEVLKVDDQCNVLLKNILICSQDLVPDRNGIVTLDFTETIERFKSEFGINLNNDHFARLEQKGVFAKRATRTDGKPVLQFELKEYKTLSQIWRILKEVEKWNEKGFVDMQEEEVIAKKKSGNSCPSCQAEIKDGQKFCGECGNKLAA